MAMLITLTRAEGPIIDCGKPATFTTFRAATARLALWARTAPANGSYDKVDVRVTFSEGGDLAWVHRFDLTRYNATDLREDLMRDLRFSVGAWCPDHLTPAQAQAWRDEMARVDPTRKQRAERTLLYLEGQD